MKAETRPNQKPIKLSEQEHRSEHDQRPWNWGAFFQRHRKLFLTLIIILIILFSLAVMIRLFGLDTALYNFTNQFTEKTGIPVNYFLKEKLNSVFRVIDEINIFKIKKDLLDGTLPIYELKLSDGDLKHVQNVSELSTNQGYLSEELNTWRQVELKVAGQNYDAKIKLHGDIPIHWSNYLKSYKVKITDGAVNNLERFNLILFEDRHLSGKISTVLAAELGLFTIRDDVVVLKINGVIQGMYYLEEDLGPDFLESNQCSSCVILQTTDNFIDDHPDIPGNDLNGITDGAEHGTDFDNEISNLDLDRTDNIYNPQAVYALNRLFELTNEQDLQQLKGYFDLQQLADLEAFIMLTGGVHAIQGDNLRLAYSAATGKFYPVPRNEFLGELKLINGGLENLFDERVPMFSLLSRDDQLRYLRNQKLYRYASDNQLLTEFQSLIEQYQPYALSYRTNALSSRYINYRFNKDLYALTKNLELIKQNLEYAKCYVDLVQKSDRLTVEVIPDAMAQLKFEQFTLILEQEYSGTITVVFHGSDDALNGQRTWVKTLQVSDPTDTLDLTELFTGELFSAGLDEVMDPQKRIYSFEIIFDPVVPAVQDAVLKMKNDITGQALPEDDLYYQIADGRTFSETAKTLSFVQFKAQYPQFSWTFENNVLTLRAGHYTVTEDLIIPPSDQWVIEAGTTLSLGEKVAIVSYNPVKIAGTEAAPVVIKALDEHKPFGTFAVLGQNSLTAPWESRTKTEIDWLDLSGGYETVVQGIYFSGGLSIYNSDLEISNSKIHHNHADDGLNVKYGQVQMDHCQLYDNFADQFDCDFCTGYIINSNFKETEAEADDNGDGLDFSGSQVLVAENTFVTFKDKGLSIGENTHLIAYQNKFINNNLGAAIKDSSHAFFIENAFQYNNISLSAYQKKLLYDGGNTYIYQNTYQENTAEYQGDELSKLYQVNFEPEDYRQLQSALQNREVVAAFAILDKYATWKSAVTN